MGWNQRLAYIMGTVDQALLRRNAYLVTENRTLRHQSTGRVPLTEGERITLAEIGQKVGTQALQTDDLGGGCRTGATPLAHQPLARATKAHTACIPDHRSLRTVSRRRTQGWLSLFLLVSITALVGCGGDDGPNLGGTFEGTIQDSVAGPGTLRVTLAQTAADLSGTFQSRFANPANNDAGVVSGMVSGDRVVLTAVPSALPPCPFRVTGTVQGTRITGPYAAFNCTSALSGSIDVTKQ